MAAIRDALSRIIDESGELYRSDLVVDDGNGLPWSNTKRTPTQRTKSSSSFSLRLISKAAPRPVEACLVYLDLKRLDYKQLQT